nr:MAG TPA: hypothetical protein [Caudoviricetes sp.]
MNSTSNKKEPQMRLIGVRPLTQQAFAPPRGLSVSAPE